MSKEVFELKLTDAVVLIRELTIEEYIRAHRSADSGEKSLLVQSSQIARASVAMAVVNVNGTPVTYADLQGPGWKKHLPRRRSYVQLSDYFGDLHSPTDDDAEKVKASVEATYDDETVKLREAVDQYTETGVEGEAFAEVVADILAHLRDIREEAGQTAGKVIGLQSPQRLA